MNLPGSDETLWQKRWIPVRGWVIAAACLVPVLAAVFVEPIAQDPGYHQFADTRTLGGIPNALNVLSNAFLFIAGVAGLWIVARHRHRQPQALWWPYATLYLGLLLTGVGSAWYHAIPDNNTLVWDRLPMTIIFMSFFCSVVGEVVDRKLAHGLLPVMLLLGLGSVWHWHVTELRGAGDLRAYALVQFLPMLIIPLLIMLYPRPHHYLPWALGMMVLYILSKVFEFYDAAVFALGGVVSGHSLKHLLAALSPACLLPMLWRRSSGKY